MDKLGIRVKVHTGNSSFYLYGDNFDYAGETFGMLPLYMGSSIVAFLRKEYLSYDEVTTASDGLYYMFDYNEAFAETDG